MVPEKPKCPVQTYPLAAGIDHVLALDEDLLDQVLAASQKCCCVQGYAGQKGSEFRPV